MAWKASGQSVRVLFAVWENGFPIRGSSLGMRTGADHEDGCFFLKSDSPNDMMKAVKQRTKCIRFLYDVLGSAAMGRL